MNCPHCGGYITPLAGAKPDRPAPANEPKLTAEQKERRRNLNERINKIKGKA